MVAWSKQWRNLKIKTWNCFSLSKERHNFCERLGYDILARTERHNRQNIFPHSKTWIPCRKLPNWTETRKMYGPGSWRDNNALEANGAVLPGFRSRRQSNSVGQNCRTSVQHLFRGGLYTAQMQSYTASRRHD